MTEFMSRMTKGKKPNEGTKKMDQMVLVGAAKRMNRDLLASEYRGPGDTLEAAAYRLQTKMGVPASTTLRLWNRDVTDMLVSSFAPVLNAWLALKNKANRAADRVEHAYETQRDNAVDPRVLRLADFVAGFEAKAKEEADEG